MVRTRDGDHDKPGLDTAGRKMAMDENKTQMGLPKPRSPANDNSDPQKHKTQENTEEETGRYVSIEARRFLW